MTFTSLRLHSEVKNGSNPEVKKGKQSQTDPEYHFQWFTVGVTVQITLSDKLTAF